MAATPNAREAVQARDMEDLQYEMMYEEPQCCGFFWKFLAVLGCRTYSPQGRSGLCVMFFFVLAALAAVGYVCVAYVKPALLLRVVFILAEASILLAVVQFLVKVVFSSVPEPMPKEQAAEEAKSTLLTPGAIQNEEQKARQNRAAALKGCPLWVAPVAVVLLVVGLDAALWFLKVKQDDLIYIGIVVFVSINVMIIIGWSLSKVESKFAEQLQEDLQVSEPGKMGPFAKKMESRSRMAAIVVALLLTAAGFVVMFWGVNGTDLMYFFIAFLVIEIALGLLLVVQSQLTVALVNVLPAAGKAGPEVRANDAYRNVSFKKNKEENATS